MSWLQNIFEGVLTEIRADDAYEKFYSSIPRKIYDEILGGRGDVDRFYRFFLDCVRDRISSPQEAINALAKFKECDGVLKQRLMNKLAAGEYETVEEFVTDLNYFKSGGGIISRKKYAKEGYIKIGETENWIITTTTTYTANNGNFSDTHWCTASDRAGDHDGYTMFLRYLKNYGKDCVYYQFRWKGKDLYGNKDTDCEQFVDDNENLFDPEKGFIGDKMPKRFGLFQITINRDGEMPQVFDYYDWERDEGFLKKFVGADAIAIVKRTDIFDKVLELVNAQKERENKYLEAMAEVQRKRRRKREERYYAELERYQIQADEKNKEKEREIAKEWASLVQSREYMTPEFVSTMMNRDISFYQQIDPDTLPPEEREENLKKTKYAFIYESVCLFDDEVEGGQNKLWLLKIHPVIGLAYSVDEPTRQTLEPNFSEIFEFREWRCDNCIDDCMMMIVRVNGVELSVLDHNVTEYEVRGPWRVGTYRWMRKHIGKGYYYTIQDEKITIIDRNNGNLFEAPGFKNDCDVSILEYPYIIFYEEDDWSKWVLYNTETKSTKFSSESPNIKVNFSHGDGFTIITDNGVQTAYVEMNHTVLPMRLPSGDEIINLFDASIDDDGSIFFVKFDSDEGAYCNFFIPGSNEFVFGVKGISGSHNYGENFCSIEFFKEREDNYYKLTYYIDSGKYMLTSGYGNKEESDRFGRTRKELYGEKNLRDFWAKGGYTPEQKAQMDKMWADRERELNTVDDTYFEPYNQDDMGHDRARPGAIKLERSPFTDSLQQFDDDDDWRGYVGLRDPGGAKEAVDNWFGSEEDLKKAVGQNPWFRISKYGDSMDQEWRDEDEVPARFTDPSLNEAKKLPTKLISIWNKLGLND